jgi:hypothetical protein
MPRETAISSHLEPVAERFTNQLYILRKLPPWNFHTVCATGDDSNCANLVQFGLFLRE